MSLHEQLTSTISSCGFAAHIENKSMQEIVSLIEGLLDVQVSALTASNKMTSVREKFLESSGGRPLEVLIPAQTQDKLYDLLLQYASRPAEPRR